MLERTALQDPLPHFPKVPTGVGGLKIAIGALTLFVIPDRDDGDIHIAHDGLPEIVEAVVCAAKLAFSL